MYKKFYLNYVLTSLLCLFLIPKDCFGQSPEFSLREFASGQIKKGVRSIGMGGDGATWGNYSLIWKDTGTAIIDGGTSHYSNDNNFSFTAVGFTTPSLWHGLAIYAIALSQYSSNVAISLKSPGLGIGAIPTHGDGTNQSLFIKAAMPIGKGFSFGILVSYERSQFDAISDGNKSDYVRFQTSWQPSGGFGISWQPSSRFLIGFRGLFNNDLEKRIDNTGTYQGVSQTNEYRLGASISLWQGALIDAGGNIRSTYNQIYNTRHLNPAPNLGFEQNLYKRHFAFRFGLDESSETGGISIRFRPVAIDVAYVHNLGIARFGNLFGTNSNSFLATFSFNYETLLHRNR